MYYIKAAFKGRFGRFLGRAVCGVYHFGSGLYGKYGQSNSIGAAFSEVFNYYHLNVPPAAVGAVIAVLSLFIFLGGTKRLASVVEKLCAGDGRFLYCGKACSSSVCTFTHVPEAFRMILVGAF